MAKVQGGPCCHHIQAKDCGSKILRNVGILLQRCTASQPSRPRLEVILLFTPYVCLLTRDYVSQENRIWGRYISHISFLALVFLES